MRWILAAVVIGLAMAQAGALEISQAEMENRRCLNCHGQSDIAMRTPQERASMVAPATQPAKWLAEAPKTRPGLYVTSDTLAKSVHASLACVDCHADAKDLPHAAKLSKISCATRCHKEAGSEWLQGAHAMAAARGEPRAPTCANCHGGHDILPATDRRSRTFPLNIVKVCGDCHAEHRTNSDGLDGKTFITSYLESVHGQALLKGGLSVSATCADCHGHHKVLPAADPQSTINRNHVAETCGKCHTGISETYLKSVHGRELTKGNKLAPVCTDCHTAHRISRTDKSAFMLDIVSECGNCHDRQAKKQGKVGLYETYRRSYHGQVTALGSTRAARCSDCHGAHDIQRINDPDSRLNAANRVATCQKCHPGATASFAEFAPHADMHDAKHYPLLHGIWLYFVIMMSAAFGFFGLHCLLWFIRSLIERIKNGRPPKYVANLHAIKRFSKVDRVNHAFVIISFFGLALTGLPLLYAEKGWGRDMVEFFGGVRTCGLLHRFFALILIGNLLVHAVGVIRRIKKHGFFKLLFGPTTMLPRIKDFKDCAGMFRWFFRGGKKPPFDRWTYWEKFDYVAEVGGSLIIGASGLLLWFPVFFSKFLPGWMFNVATVVHGYEALLAVGFIFTIHFFNAHLRLEKFPVDDVMFTGCLPEAELAHERPEEYARLVATGEIEGLRVQPAPSWYRVVAVAAGVVAMAIGTTIAVLIILAGLNLT